MSYRQAEENYNPLLVCKGKTVFPLDYMTAFDISLN